VLGTRSLDRELGTRARDGSLEQGAWNKGSGLKLGTGARDWSSGLELGTKARDWSSGAWGRGGEGGTASRQLWTRGVPIYLPPAARVRERERASERLGSERGWGDSRGWGLRKNNSLNPKRMK
jgi:hypothetical protein